MPSQGKWWPKGGRVQKQADINGKAESELSPKFKRLSIKPRTSSMAVSATSTASGFAGCRDASSCDDNRGDYRDHRARPEAALNDALTLRTIAALRAA
jgi:hypothetical protein